MLKDVLNETDNRMKKCLDNLHHEMVKIRTGRAHPSLLEEITVIYYNNPTPLNQVASITVEDARTLSISPWDKSAVQAIEKAIMGSDLGLNPTTAGSVIRVTMPPLTEDRRKTLVKHLRGIAEESRVSVRNVRRDSNAKLKELLKAKSITEDEERKGEEGIQKLTDRFIGEIDKLVTQKEAELMQV